MVEENLILDATCGLKQMWFKKEDEKTIYLDRRHGRILYDKKHVANRPDYFYNHIITPNIVADNRFLPFKDETFNLVLYDPPHIISGGKGILTCKYGSLKPSSWQKDIYQASREIFRVLKNNGFLVLKWAESSRTLKKILPIFPVTPLFGTNVAHNTSAKCWWIVFRKDGETP